jgi:hypothetical protein
LQDDLLDNPNRRQQLIDALWHRLGEVKKCNNGDSAKQVEILLSAAYRAIENFENGFKEVEQIRKRARKALGRHTANDNICLMAFHARRMSPMQRIGALSFLWLF